MSEKKECDGRIAAAVVLGFAGLIASGFIIASSFTPKPPVLATLTYDVKDYLGGIVLKSRVAEMTDSVEYDNCQAQKMADETELKKHGIKVPEVPAASFSIGNDFSFRTDNQSDAN